MDPVRNIAQKIYENKKSLPITDQKIKTKDL